MAAKSKTLDQEEEELKAKLAEIKEKKAQIASEKQRIIGDVVWNEMPKDSNLAHTIIKLLEEKVVKNADRALFDLPKRQRKPKQKNGGDVVGEG